MSSDIKIKVQSFGRFLSNMVMPNIGAFIAWGIITAIIYSNRVVTERDAGEAGRADDHLSPAAADRLYRW
ncbi:hypothetical protein VEE57_23910 [Escherichia coli]|nr:hypothetical protein VEE57_23910 [Escherichia coli]